MTAIKAADVERFVAQPSAGQPIVLVFGPDGGLVSERAEALVRASVDDPNDGFAVTKLAGDELAGDPARLIDEAQAIPMFGGRRAIRVRAGSRNFVPAVEAVLAAPLRDCRVVIEAGDLKRNAPLRTLCERARNAAAVACYADDERSLARLIDVELREAGLSITADARGALLPLLGGDRRASRNELRKLALYAHGHGKVELEDVLAIVGDASGEALDALVDAVFAGRPAEFDTHFSRARETAAAPGTIVAAASRQCASLHRLRLAVDSGMGPAEVVRNNRVHFRRIPAWEQALRRWSAPQLAQALTDLGATAFRIRQSPALGESHAHRALIQIAMAAARK
jgi:DNA polymerase III subunit delta